MLTDLLVYENLDLIPVHKVDVTLLSFLSVQNCAFRSCIIKICVHIGTSPLQTSVKMVSSSAIQTAGLYGFHFVH